MRGVLLIILGLAKKMAFADQFAQVADAYFSSLAAHPGALAAWKGVGAFALQIFFDFSGYSDMAIGMALLLGFHFPQNFRRPYLAFSITDFWHRWHMTLSRWLRDYLYIPLGGNRHGTLMTYRNLMLTMLLGGLWHGASWNFVVWGGYHGALLSHRTHAGPQNVRRPSAGLAISVPRGADRRAGVASAGYSSAPRLSPTAATSSRQMFSFSAGAPVFEVGRWLMLDGGSRADRRDLRRMVERLRPPAQRARHRLRRGDDRNDAGGGIVRRSRQADPLRLLPVLIVPSMTSLYEDSGQPAALRPAV